MAVFDLPISWRELLNVSRATLATVDSLRDGVPVDVVQA